MFSFWWTLVHRTLLWGKCCAMVICCVYQLITDIYWLAHAVALWLFSDININLENFFWACMNCFLVVAPTMVCCCSPFASMCFCIFSDDLLNTLVVFRRSSLNVWLTFFSFLDHSLKTPEVTSGKIPQISSFWNTGNATNIQSVQSTFISILMLGLNFNMCLSNVWRLKCIEFSVPNKLASESICLIPATLFESYHIKLIIENNFLQPVLNSNSNKSFCR